jgi:prohibitin 2
LKSIVAKYTASELLLNRDSISHQIKSRLVERLRDFNIVLDDVSIVDLVFGGEFTKAVSDK